MMNQHMPSRCHGSFLVSLLAFLASSFFPQFANAQTITYTYDTGCAYCAGRLRSVSDASGSTTFTYDERGRQTRVDKVIAGGSTYTTQTSYDSLDRVVNMTYPDNEVVQNTYNAQGLLSAVRSTNYPQNYVTSLSYNALSKVAAKTVGNGTVTSYDYYDAVAKGALNFRLHNVSTPGLQNLTYAYDPAGNISSVTDSLKAATQTFGYDSLHRLTSASSAAAPAYTHAYAYNAIGNVTVLNAAAYTYPAAGAARPHAPTGDGACTYGYDANGSLLNRTCGATARSFAWDYDNRLNQVQDGTTVLGTFTYDYAGTRVKKVEGAATTLTPFPHYRSVNGAITKYYFANGERVAERTGPAATDVFYYHSDHLGSSNTVSNSAGAEVKATLFLPYGATRSETGTKTLAHQYTGQEKDSPTGLYNYGARYYDPGFMHFISADNIIPDASDPQMLNRYAYVRNNPIRLVDPAGKAPRDSQLLCYGYPQQEIRPMVAQSIFGGYRYDSSFVREVGPTLAPYTQIKTLALAGAAAASLAAVPAEIAVAASAVTAYKTGLFIQNGERGYDLLDHTLFTVTNSALAISGAVKLGAGVSAAIPFAQQLGYKMAGNSLIFTGSQMADRAYMGQSTSLSDFATLFATNALSVGIQGNYFSAPFDVPLWASVIGRTSTALLLQSAIDSNSQLPYLNSVPMGASPSYSNWQTLQFNEVAEGWNYNQIAE